MKGWQRNPHQDRRDPLVLPVIIAVAVFVVLVAAVGFVLIHWAG